MNPKIDEYLLSIPKWQEELEMLRMMVLDCGLTEELKWGVPCYTFQQTNVLILGAFKEYCTISFLKGVLLNDAHAVLSKPGENTQAARLIRFTNLSEIIAMEAVLKTYIYEAIEVEKAGLKASGVNPDTGLVEIIEIENHPFFIGVQYHPEYKSTVANPHPIFVGFVKAAVQHKTVSV